MTEKTLHEIAQEAFDRAFNIATSTKDPDGISLLDADVIAIKAVAVAVAERCAEIADWSINAREAASRIRQLIENNKEDKGGAE